MYLVPIVAWIAALVLASIVLAFCSYEVWWKARRLQGDLDRLEALNQRVARLQDDVAVVQRRIRAATHVRSASVD